VLFRVLASASYISRLQYSGSLNLQPIIGRARSDITHSLSQYNRRGQNP